MAGCSETGGRARCQTVPMVEAPRRAGPGEPSEKCRGLEICKPTVVPDISMSRQDSPHTPYNIYIQGAGGREGDMDSVRAHAELGWLLATGAALR